MAQDGSVAGTEETLRSTLGEDGYDDHRWLSSRSGSMCSGEFGRRWPRRCQLMVGIRLGGRRTGVGDRWQKVEELLDPEDVAAGYIVRFRLSPQAKIVRWRSRGLSGWSSVSRRRAPKRRTYEPRSRIRCGICERKMESCNAQRGEVLPVQCPDLGAGIGNRVGASVADLLREELVTTAINRRVGELFGRLNRQITIDLLLEADDKSARREDQVVQLRNRVAAGEVVMGAVAAGVGWDGSGEAAWAVQRGRGGEAGRTGRPHAVSL
jgi:hypothetical protein